MSIQNPDETRNTKATTLSEHIQERNGTVLGTLPNALYSVELDGGSRIVAHASGKARIDVVRVLPGDRVTVQLTPFDRARGRIIRTNR